MTTYLHILPIFSVEVKSFRAVIASIIKAIRSVSEYTGMVASWLTSALVLLIMYDVVMRYFLNISHVWVTEMECHLFAMIFLLGAAYTLKYDAHVRVDLFYSNFSSRNKALVNAIGVVLFLIPWCLVVIRASLKYANNSFQIRETSPDPGGLPALYVVKFMIVVAFILLLLEGLALLLESIQIFRKRDVSPGETSQG